MLTNEQKDRIAEILSEKFEARFVLPMNEVLEKLQEAVLSIPDETFGHCSKYGTAFAQGWERAVKDAPFFRDTTVTIDFAGGAYNGVRTESRIDFAFYNKRKTTEANFSLRTGIGVDVGRVAGKLIYVLGGSEQPIRNIVNSYADTRPELVTAFKDMLDDADFDSLIRICAGYAEWYTKRWSSSETAACAKEKANDNLLLSEFGLCDDKEDAPLPIYEVTISKKN